MRHCADLVAIFWERWRFHGVGVTVKMCARIRVWLRCNTYNLCVCDFDCICVCISTGEREWCARFVCVFTVPYLLSITHTRIDRNPLRPTHQCKTRSIGSSVLEETPHWIIDKHVSENCESGKRRYKCLAQHMSSIYSLHTHTPFDSIKWGDLSSKLPICRQLIRYSHFLPYNDILMRGFFTMNSLIKTPECLFEMA